MVFGEQAEKRWKEEKRRKEKRKREEAEEVEEKEPSPVKTVQKKEGDRCLFSVLPYSDLPFIEQFMDEVVVMNPDSPFDPETMKIRNQAPSARVLKSGYLKVGSVGQKERTS